jgi:hypothetical protein
MPKSSKKTAKKTAKKSSKRTSKKGKSVGIAPLARKVSSIENRLGKVESVLGPQFKEFTS